MGTSLLILSTGLILASYLFFQFIRPSTGVKEGEKAIRQVYPWSFLLLCLTLALETSPAFRETNAYLPYVCLQTLCLAFCLLQPKCGTYLIPGLAAFILVSFMATGSLALGVRVFEIALLVGLVKRQFKYWLVLFVFIGSMSCLQSVKSIYRGEVARETASAPTGHVHLFLQSLKKSPLGIPEEKNPKSLSPRKLVPYYGYGVGKIIPHFADKSVLPWDLGEWKDLYSWLLASRAYLDLPSSRFNEGYIRFKLGIDPEPHLSLIALSMASSVSANFSKLGGSQFLYPVFQFSPNLFEFEDDQYFPRSSLFGLNTFPSQEWNSAFFAYTRGLLRLGDDTLDRVLLLSPIEIPFVKGKTYSFMPNPQTAKAIANDFGRRYGYLSFWDDKTTVNFNQFSEAYMNFGYPGLLLAALLFGGMLYVLQAILVGLSPGIHDLAFVALGKILFFPKETSALLSALFVTLVLIGLIECAIFQKKKARKRNSFPLEISSRRS